MIFNMGGAENVEGKMPEFTYTGTYQLIDDGIVDGVQNWRAKFLTSGVLTFKKVVKKIDLFMVGGGGGSAGAFSGGAGGGYTKTVNGISVSRGTQYTIIVGAGGTGGAGGNPGSEGAVGGTTEAFGHTASGGGNGLLAGTGGPGGSGGAGVSDDRQAVPNGGSDGGDGASGTKAGGKGQGTTTREFGETDGTVYAGGGGGGRRYFNATQAAGGAGGGGKGGTEYSNKTYLGEHGGENTGGGAGGGVTWSTGRSGGSGIVVIRNAR